MRKFILGLMLMISVTTSYGKCDWSSYKLYQSNNRNYYTFVLNGNGMGDDTCINWMWLVYDNQTKKVDTLREYDLGYLQVQFNKKGKYKLYVKIWDKCKKCDTVFYKEINIQYFDKVGFSKTQKSCKNFIYEIAPQTTVKGDTCYSYYHYIYSGKFIDSLNNTEWDTIKLNRLAIFYDFPDSDLDTIHDSRLFNYTYPKNGRYLIVSQVFNWCNYQDTFLMNKVTIDCNTSGVKNVVKNEDIKVIGYYDMIGRKVDYMEFDVPYIIVYNNGKRQKVIRTK
jgi:hypothetical protein